MKFIRPYKRRWAVLFISRPDTRREKLGLSCMPGRLVLLSNTNLFGQRARFLAGRRDGCSSFNVDALKFDAHAASVVFSSEFQKFNSVRF